MQEDRSCEKRGTHEWGISTQKCLWKETGKVGNDTVLGNVFLKVPVKGD